MLQSIKKYSSVFIPELSSGRIALMMEAARTPETLVNFYQTTRRCNPEDSHPRTHRRENLRSYHIPFRQWMHNCSGQDFVHFSSQHNTQVFEFHSARTKCK
jgi:hypothetical protein